METSTLKGEFYSLRWTNYKGNLCDSLANYEAFEKLADVTLVCEGQNIKVHKLVLSVCSGFFQEMFKGGTAGTNNLCSSLIQPVIVIHGAKFQHLKHIVDFIYQGEIRVLDSDLEGVLSLGETLQIKGLCSVKLRPKGIQTTPELKTNVLPNSVKPSVKAKTSVLRSALATVPAVPSSTNDSKKIQSKQKSETDNILPLCSLSMAEFNASVKLASKDTTSAFTLDKTVPNTTDITKLKQKGSESLLKTQQESHHKSEKEPYDKAKREDLIKRRAIPNQSVLIEMKPDDNLISPFKMSDVFEPPSKKLKSLAPKVEIVEHEMDTVGTLIPMHKENLIQPAEDKNNSTNSETIDKKDLSNTSSNVKSAADSTSLDRDDTLNLSIKEISNRSKEEEEKRVENIPRPPNAFMIFANEWRKKLSVEHPEENNKDISVRLGSLWKSLSQETKETYYLSAAKAQEEHRVKYGLDASQLLILKNKKKIVSPAKSGSLVKNASLSDSVGVSGDGSSEVIDCDLDDSSRDTVFSTFSNKSN